MENNPNILLYSAAIAAFTSLLVTIITKLIDSRNNTKNRRHTFQETQFKQRIIAYELSAAQRTSIVDTLQSLLHSMEKVFEAKSDVEVGQILEGLKKAGQLYEKANEETQLGSKKTFLYLDYEINDQELGKEAENLFNSLIPLVFNYALKKSSKPSEHVLLRHEILEKLEGFRDIIRRLKEINALYIKALREDLAKYD